MTPKEKAEVLVESYYSTIMSFLSDNMRWENAKKGALIAVDEVLNVLPQHEYLEDRDEYHENRERLYWQEVKQEIEKL